MPNPADAPTVQAPLTPVPSKAADGVRATDDGRGPPRWRRMAQALGWPAALPGMLDLAAARQACVDCLSELPSPEAQALGQRLAHAESLAELWHLRPELYSLLALQLSQTEAERRLEATKAFLDRRRS